MLAESQRCLKALGVGNIQYFVDHLAPKDKWRILAQYFQQATFFDIETMGLELDDPITVIVCWHKQQFHNFVEHENLDEFLELLDQIELLVSFNGSTFDVPRVLSTFHIPELPCAHLDLRWTTYHQGFSGGLKEISSRMGIERPADLQDVNGAHAILLWQAWRDQQDTAAREHLIRYCAADVLLLAMAAKHLIGGEQESLYELWETLPTVSSTPEVLLQPPRKIDNGPVMFDSRSLKRKRVMLSKRRANRSA